jgi:EAL domain-containing protein (putative c-di-GMP-specific phosphodiesterase class I)
MTASTPGQACGACRDGRALDFPIAMAFQPIVEPARRAIVAYEALVRGPNGEPAGSVLARVDEANRYAFDQACRVKAIETFCTLGQGDGAAKLHINFMPNAVYDPDTCIRTSLTAARRHGLPIERITFELTENERVTQHEHLRRIVTAYRAQGFGTAIDDFGSGYAGLGLLVEFQPDEIKIDMTLLRGIDTDPVRRAVVAGIVTTARELGISLIAEGVETAAEFAVLSGMGIERYQGFLFARPGFNTLATAADINWP